VYRILRTMTFANLSSRVPARIWAYLSLIVWGVITLLLASRTPFGLEEGGAKALLLAWSVADQVASSVVTFSAPDLRTLLFMPVGMLWPGNVFAAKVLLAIGIAHTAWLLFDWQRRRSGDEAALLSVGVWLIAPSTLAQIDQLGPAPFLIWCFALGRRLDDAYRVAPRPFGGNFFAQLALCALAVSLHPAGLAYPAALAWGWWKQPLDRAQQRSFLAGIGLVTLVTLVARVSWNDVTLLADPLPALAGVLVRSDGGLDAAGWVAVVAVVAVTIVVALLQRRALLGDLLGNSLLLGVLLGAVAADATWGVLLLLLLLLFGFPMLLQPPDPGKTPGFLGQRGIALAVLCVLCLTYMFADKQRYLEHRDGQMSAQDALIRTLADEVAGERAAVAGDRDEAKKLHVRVASQWPSRTMVACKCDTLPLPPAAADPDAQLAMLRTVTLVVLDPKAPANRTLSGNLAALGGRVETVGLQPGGVILRLRDNEAAAGTSK